MSLRSAFKYCMRAITLKKLLLKTMQTHNLFSLFHMKMDVVLKKTSLKLKSFGRKQRYKGMSKLKNNY